MDGRASDRQTPNDNDGLVMDLCVMLIIQSPRPCFQSVCNWTLPAMRDASAWRWLMAMQLCGVNALNKADRTSRGLCIVCT